MASPTSGQIHRSSSNNASFDDSLTPSQDQSEMNVSLPSELEGSNEPASNIPSSRTIHKLNALQTLFDKITVHDNRNSVNIATEQITVDSNNRYSNGQLGDETVQSSISNPTSPCSSATVSPTNAKNALQSEIINNPKSVQNGTKSPRSSVIIQNGCHNTTGQNIGATSPLSERLTNNDAKMNKVNSGPILQTSQSETALSEAVTSATTNRYNYSYIFIYLLRYII